MNNKDNKNDVQYKDFWIAGFRIDGRFRKLLNHWSIELGKSKKEIVIRSIVGFLNKQTVQDERCKRLLAEADESLKQIYPNGQKQTVNQLSKNILEYLKMCHKEDKYDYLKELDDVINRRKRAIFNEQDRVIDQI
jgi:hypothetical protein